MCFHVFFGIFGNDYSSRYPLSRFSGVNSGPLVLSTVRVIYPYTENGYLRVSIIRNLWGSFSFSIQTPGEVFYGTDCECSNMNCPKDPDTGIVCGGVLKRCWSFSPSEWVLCFMWLTLMFVCVIAMQVEASVTVDDATALEIGQVHPAVVVQTQVNVSRTGWEWTNERTHRTRAKTCTQFQIYRYVYTDPSKHTNKLKVSNISLSVYRGNTCGQYLVVLILFGLLSNLHKNRSGCFNTRFRVRLPSLD